MIWQLSQAGKIKNHYVRKRKLQHEIPHGRSLDVRSRRYCSWSWNVIQTINSNNFMKSKQFILCFYFWGAGINLISFSTYDLKVRMWLSKLARKYGTSSIKMEMKRCNISFWLKKHTRIFCIVSVIFTKEFLARF